MRDFNFRRFQDKKHKKEARLRLKIRDRHFQDNNPFYYKGKMRGTPSWENKALVGMKARTPAMCPCAGCSIKRKYYGKTLAELFMDLEQKEQIDEIAS